MDQDSAPSPTLILSEIKCVVLVFVSNVWVRGLVHFPRTLTPALLKAGSVEGPWYEWKSRCLGGGEETSRVTQSMGSCSCSLSILSLYPFCNGFQSCLVDSEPSAHWSWLRPKCLQWRSKLPPDLAKDFTSQAKTIKSSLMAVGDRLSVGPGGIPKSLNSTINSGSHLVSWGRKRGQLTGRSGSLVHQLCALQVSACTHKWRTTCWFTLRVRQRRHSNHREQGLQKAHLKRGQLLLFCEIALKILRQCIPLGVCCYMQMTPG